MHNRGMAQCIMLKARSRRRPPGGLDLKPQSIKSADPRSTLASRPRGGVQNVSWGSPNRRHKMKMCIVSLFSKLVMAQWRILKARSRREASRRSRPQASNHTRPTLKPRLKGCWHWHWTSPGASVGPQSLAPPSPQAQLCWPPLRAPQVPPQSSLRQFPQGPTTSWPQQPSP